MAILQGTPGDDTLVAPGDRDADVVIGLAGNDRIEARGGDDRIDPGPGNDRVEGGDGEDTVVYAGALALHEVWRDPDIALGVDRSVFGVGVSAGREAVVRGPEGVDALRDIETLEFAGGLRLALDDAPVFPGLAYLASHPDVGRAVGIDPGAAFDHFRQFGAAEGRSLRFDPLDYLAANPDLIVVYGDNILGATEHYLRTGSAEGRRAGGLFDLTAYLAGNPDLARAFGGDQAAALRHYVRFGFNEGRGAGGDPLDYIASHDDLIAAYGPDARLGGWHSLTYGAAEDRAASFDGLQYVAGYPDLALALRVPGDPAVTARAGAEHFIRYGHAEDRSRDGFDERQYAANNPDLGAAGLDTPDELALHWITFGVTEGRSDDAPLL